MSYIFYDVRNTLYFVTFELHIKKRYNYVSFLFMIVRYVLLIHNDVIYLLDAVTFFW